MLHDFRWSSRTFLYFPRWDTLLKIFGFAQSVFSVYVNMMHDLHFRRNFTVSKSISSGSYILCMCIRKNLEIFDKFCWELISENIWIWFAESNRMLAETLNSNKHSMYICFISWQYYARMILNKKNWFAFSQMSIITVDFLFYLMSVIFLLIVIILSNFTLKNAKITTKKYDCKLRIAFPHLGSEQSDRQVLSCKIHISQVLLHSCINIQRNTFFSHYSCIYLFFSNAHKEYSR